MSRRPYFHYTRRGALLAGAGVLATPAFGQTRCGKPLEGHVKGTPVWGGYDQVELDAAYTQEIYQPHLETMNSRLKAASFELRKRRGEPKRAAYGEYRDEGLDIYRADATGAPVFVFVHGGTWRFHSAGHTAFAAEMFLDHGAHYVALDFSSVAMLDGDLGVTADQVRRGIAWVMRNAQSFGGNPEKIFIGGHSSGGHLAAVALTTDWSAFDLPADTVKGGLCMSGMYDLAPVRLSWRSNYIGFTDEMEEAMSPQRHLDRISSPVVVSYGSLETPEFQRQAKDFATALEAAGKQVTLNVGHFLYHQDTWETLGNPYGLNGRAALSMMGL